MATVDPPYRLDPLQNPVKVKGEPEGEGPVPEPGHEDCWGLFPQLRILPATEPFVAWQKGDQSGLTTDPGEAAGSFGFSIWAMTESGNAIDCYEWEWLVGTECGFAPGPQETPPTEPPDDWEGYDRSPNSEE